MYPVTNDRNTLSWCFENALSDSDKRWILRSEKDMHLMRSAANATDRSAARLRHAIGRKSIYTLARNLGMLLHD